MIVLPALMPGMEEGLLARWCVKPGDIVAVGDVLAEVETDKATIELPATIAGVIEEIYVPEGTAGVRVNTPLARMREAGDTVSDATEPVAGDQASGNAIGGDLPPTARAHDVTQGPADHAARSSARVPASPMARRMARAAELELDALAGSGPGGRIVKRDVEAAARSAVRANEADASAAEADARFAEASTALNALGIAPGSYDLLPLDGMRRTIAARMTSAFRDIPHFALTAHLQMDEMLALRGRLNASDDSRAKITINDMLLKAAAAALVRVPAANASYTPAGIARHRHADIAFAVAHDDLLITPIVRAAEHKSLGVIARETRELAELARNGRLQPRQFQGGSFTLSNLGMFGVHSFGSILNPPHGCILSVGAIERRVVVNDGGPAVASMATVTLTCDHRVVDGIVGARWLAALRQIVEEPSGLLA